MEILREFFGSGKDLSIFQMCMRTILVFLITLILIRISGKRTFGMRMPMDNVLTILIGALLSRIIVGASPFVATLCSTITIVVLYRICASLSVYSKFFGKLVKGEETLIYKDGLMFKDNMKREMITEKDLIEELRINSNLGSLHDVKTAYLERNGEISIVKKREC